MRTGSGYLVAERLHRQLLDELRNRSAVNQAVGYLVGQYALSYDQALTFLLKKAGEDGRDPATVAREVLKRAAEQGPPARPASYSALPEHSSDQGPPSVPGHR